MDLHSRQRFLIMTRALYCYLEEQWEALGRIYNITPAQQFILFILSTHNKPLTVSQISQYGCWHISSVTRLLQPLQKNGCIEVVYDRTKSKHKYVALTQEGTTLYSKLVDHVIAAEDFPIDFSMVDPEDLILYLNMCHKILRTVKDDWLVDWLDRATANGVKYG